MNLKSTGGEGGVTLTREQCIARLEQAMRDEPLHEADPDYPYAVAILAHLRSCAQDAPGVGELAPEQVEWVVNDIAELGVKIGNQFFFMYKSSSLVYEDAQHDDGKPMHWRHVFKREFGECCHPVNYKDPTRIGTVSLDDDDEWAELPKANLSRVPPAPAGPKVTDDQQTLELWHRYATPSNSLNSGYAVRYDEFRTMVAALRSPPDVPWTASGCAPELLGKTLTENLREISAHMYSLRWKAYAETMEKAVDMIRETLFPDADTREEDALVAELINRRREYKLSEYQAKLLRSLAQRLRGAGSGK